MGCGKYWDQLSQIDAGLKALRLAGLGVGALPYETLWRARGAVLGRARALTVSPRDLLKLIVTGGWSPGEVTVWFDIESGWCAEGRAYPGAPPVYRLIPAELATALLKGTSTPEQIHALLEPDPYAGEL